MHSHGTNPQAKLNSLNPWTTTCAVFLLSFAATIAAPGQTFTTLAVFPASDRNPASPLVQGPDGNFYGFVNGGIDTGLCENQFCGAMFRVTPEGKITILHTFCLLSSCLDGWGPSSLVLGGDGNFYGVTYGGGVDFSSPCIIIGCGTIFKITPGSKLTTLYNFSCSATSCADGSQPMSLMQSFNSGGGSVYSDFYGTTPYTAFRVTPQGQLTTLSSFCIESTCTQGFAPGTLTQAVGGNFFGTSSEGGGKNCSSGYCGAIFRMTPTGALTTLHTFTLPTGPNAPLVGGADGSYYGTTRSGIFFAITPQGKLTTLYTFCSLPSCLDGANPSAIILATDGNFYGATGSTLLNGPRNTLFKVTPLGELSVLYTFCAQPNCADGSGSDYALVQGTDGKLYGTTANGGNTVCPLSGCGTFFSLDLGLAPFVKFLVGTGKVGQTVGILGQGFTGTTAVSFNGTPATFTIKSDTYLTAVVPAGATTGSVTVATSSSTLNSNVAYRVTQ